MRKRGVVPGRVRICKIQEAALEYELGASANRSLKQIRAVFVGGPGAQTSWNKRLRLLVGANAHGSPIKAA